MGSLWWFADLHPDEPGNQLLVTYLVAVGNNGEGEDGAKHLSLGVRGGHCPLGKDVQFIHHRLLYFQPRFHAADFNPGVASARSGTVLVVEPITPGVAKPTRTAPPCAPFLRLCCGVNYQRTEICTP